MRVGVRENIIKISDHGGFIKVGAEKTLYTCFEMNDFSVFNVDIDYFSLGRVHLDVHPLNVGNFRKVIDVCHGWFIDGSFHWK